MAAIPNTTRTGIPHPEYGISSPDISSTLDPICMARVNSCIQRKLANFILVSPAIEQTRSSGKKGKRKMKNKTTFSFFFILSSHLSTTALSPAMKFTKGRPSHLPK